MHIVYCKGKSWIGAGTRVRRAAGVKLDARMLGYTQLCVWYTVGRPNVTENQIE